MAYRPLPPCAEGGWGCEAGNAKSRAHLFFRRHVVPLKHLAPDENASGPFNFLVRSPWVAKALPHPGKALFLRGLQVPSSEYPGAGPG